MSVVVIRTVMRGLVPRTHAFSRSVAKTWVAGSSPAMTAGWLVGWCTPMGNKDGTTTWEIAR